MKKFVELSNDCIIEYRFMEKRIDGNKIDWVDERKIIANGKYLIDGIYLLIPECDTQGFYNGKFVKVSLTKDDVKKLSEIILCMEANNVTGIPGNDLPF